MADTLVPSVVQLNKGLNLSESPFTVEVGSLLSCNNYEITDSDGLRKIDGYEPYDGSISPSNTSLYILDVPDASAFAAGNILVATLNPYSGQTLTSPVMVGYVVATDNALDDVTVAVTNLDYLSVSSGICKLDTIAGGLTSTTITNITEGSAYYATEALYFAALTASQTFLRGAFYKRSLGASADGLHWFRDRLYAVAPLAEIRVRGRNGGGMTPSGTYTITITDGLHIGNGANSSIARVTGIRTETDVSGFKSYFYTIVPITGDYDDWMDVAESGGGGVNITGVTVVSGTAVVVDAIGFESSDDKLLAPSRAGGRGTFLWTCAPEQYYIDNGDYPMPFGWVPIAPNFTFAFTNGASVTDPIKLERTFATIPTSTLYYLTNGATIYSFNIVTYFLNEVNGPWSGSNASGDIQIKNITLVSGPIADVGPGWTVHSGNPPSGANQIADVNSSWLPATFGPKEDLLYYNSKFEFISSNFFADDTWDAFYGVSGAGRAFYYTGDLFAFIYTQTDDSKDLPRHVENHHQHLALGFQQGSLQLSVAGEPFNFNGIDGATEFGMGDRITGLQALNGTTLGVFCEQSIWGLTGTTVDNFSTSVLSPKTGCIEYTLEHVGIPVFCDGSGLRTLEQSAAYGDFVGRPMSYKVNSWLRPRLRRVSNKYTNAIGVIGSMIVRNKNQYRLFFKDGYCLTMTINDEFAGEFTMQQLVYHDGGENMTPWAWSSQVGVDGEEYLHFSYYNHRTGDQSEWVYELDKGWGFYGEFIHHSFEINWFFGESPSSFFGVKKARLYGKTHGRASLKIQSSGALTQLDSRYNTVNELIDLPYTPEFYSNDLLSRSSKPASIANRGLAIQLKISNRQEAVVEPSHTCQVLVLATTPGGAFDV